MSTIYVPFNTGRPDLDSWLLQVVTSNDTVIASEFIQSSPGLGEQVGSDTGNQVLYESEEHSPHTALVSINDLHGIDQHAARAVFSWQSGDFDAITQVPVSGKRTDFHKAFVRALRDIPAGELVTYSSLAELMGRPRATRAAATCCSHNPIPFFIPCHRVIPMEIENSLMAGRWPTHFGKFMGKPQLKTALVEAEFNHIS
ncbi:methylated-DNA--[protein]-cysteine S-methyltransferase [Arcanobacterium canis]|uniref:MGMT family protein n=1 Tax=Arcanobacterium canis TaxID=999183 RepID=A0ABY8FYH5_9ACTO|nr:MGMT family protein [Arcanobacterium canis]WFM83367.1 MGMT family protein [Arcanobacterium canis]